jgi:hypothetical protein
LQELPAPPASEIKRLELYEAPAKEVPIAAELQIEEPLKVVVAERQQLLGALLVREAR